MRTQRLVLLAAAAVGVLMSHVAPRSLWAQTQDSVALTGQVTSAEEGAMEGVLVSAKKAGSTIAIIVVSDRQGRYRFPRTRLEPGQYALRIKAAGYDLDGPDTVNITPQQTATADLILRKAKDLGSQLSNTEWLMSVPGTDAQRASIRNCGHCHTMELALRSRYNAGELVAVLERMSNYPPLAFPLMPQRAPAPRSGGGPVSREKQLAGWQQTAEYLASINLSSAPEWKFELKTLPRPTGKATQVIYTEYDLSPRTRQPHDVIVDSQGMVWYGSFGEQILAKLDPKTGQATEYKVPVLKPGAPTGSLAVRFDKDENIWLAMLYQAGIAKFNRKTETFQTWKLPPELNGDDTQINQVSPEHHDVDGKVWFQDAGTYRVFRVDLASSTFEVFEPFSIPRPNIYDVISDAQNNVYFAVLGREHIGRIDAKTKEIKLFPTPTAGSGPRRGMIDAQGRVWFGENRSDKIGMFDTKTGRFQEWPAPTPGAWPYDVTVDRNGDAWSGGEYNDRIQRLDPKTGQFTEYLLPKKTNVRRVFVDNSTTPVTFWVGNNHGASIVKLEPLDGITQASR